MKKISKGFIDVYDAVKNKYTFVSAIKLMMKSMKNARCFLKKPVLNTITYYNRIEELLKHITFEIIKSINEKTPFVISYREMIAYSEDICARFTDQYMYPVYSEFKKLNKIDFADLKIAQSREYKQLLACKMPQKLIETHLQYSSYYQNVCYKVFGIKQNKQDTRYRSNNI